MAISYFATAFDTGGINNGDNSAYKELSITGGQVGDRLVVAAVNADWSTTGQTRSLVTLSGSTSAWTIASEVGVAGSTIDSIIGYSTVSTAGTVTVRVTLRSVIAPMGVSAWLIPAAEHSGTPSFTTVNPINYASLTPTLTETSNVFLAAGDWLALDLGSPTLSPTGTLHVDAFVSGQYQAFVASWASQTSGTRAYGLASDPGEVTYGLVLCSVPTGGTPDPVFAYDTNTLAAVHAAAGTQTTSHVASADARAAVVLIDQNGSTADQVSGVTYGGVAMTRLRFDTESTEAGGVYIYWLDDVTPGTQNVVMTSTDTANKRLVVATMTAAPGYAIEVAGDNTGTSTSSSNPTWSITGLTAGTKLEAFEVIHSGLTTMTQTPQANWTLIHATDLGAQGRGFARQSVASSGTTLSCGWTAATADDFVGASVAFKEVAGANTGAGSGATTFTGSAAGTKVPKATGTGSTVFVGTASGTRVSSGTATGSTIFAGTSSGESPPNHGASSGDTTYVGIASGTKMPKASGSGSTTFVGTSSGTKMPKASGSGTTTYIGIASGGFPRTGSAIGNTTYVGTASGQRVPKASGIGSTVYAGTATGSKPSKGLSTGSTVYSGLATGTTMPKASGTGSTVLVGSASGSRVSRGSSVGTTEYTSEAIAGDGQYGAGTGSTVYSGSASGTKMPKASATGSSISVGSSSGIKSPRGSSLGNTTFVSSASGDVPPNRGSATGSTTYVGIASGKKTPKASASGASTYIGTASGDMPPNRGSATGSSIYVGAASGRTMPKGSAVGTTTYTAIGIGGDGQYGAGSGSTNYAGVASGKHISKGVSYGATSYTSSAAGMLPAKGSGSSLTTSLGTASGLYLSFGYATGTTTYVGIATGVKDTIQHDAEVIVTLLPRRWDGDLLPRRWDGSIQSQRRWEGQLL